MGKREDVLDRIQESKIIAMIRRVSGDRGEQVVDALVSGGIRCIEITLNTPGGLDMISSVKKRHPGICVGAGTVLTVIGAKLAAEAGADFIQGPTLSVSVIRYCNKRDLLPVPGVFTATEVFAASASGAALIKIFPAGPVGPSYIKELLEPLDGLRLLPVGGITLENVAEFMKAGSFAVGVGENLASPDLAARGAYGEIEKRAAQFIECVRAR